MYKFFLITIFCAHVCFTRIDSKQTEYCTEYPKEILESQESEFLLLSFENLKVLEDGGDREQNSGSRADGSDEVCEDSESSDAETSQESGGGDVSVEHVNERGVAIALHGQSVVSQLLRHIPRGGS